MISEDKLLFLVSQPRAGSTLVQKLVSNNDLVDTASEPWILLPFLSINRPDLINAKYNYHLAHSGMVDFLRKTKQEASFNDSLKSLILQVYSTSQSNNYFLDKTPRYYEILPELSAMFPNAKFLILKRNPFAAYNSMIDIWTEGKINFKSFNNYYRDFLVAPKLIHEFSLKNRSNPNVFEIYYESIMLNPVEEIASVYNWLGIPFTEAVLNISDNTKTFGLFGDDAQKQNPLLSLSSASIDNWKVKLSDPLFNELMRAYHNYLGEDFCSQYGYPGIFESKITPRTDQKKGTGIESKKPRVFKRAVKGIFASMGLEIRKTNVVPVTNEFDNLTDYISWLKSTNKI